MPSGTDHARRSAQDLIFLARRIAAAILALQLVLATAAGLNQFRVGWLAITVTVCALIVLGIAVLRPQWTLAVAVACACLAVVQLVNLDLSVAVLTVALVNPWLRLEQWMFSLGPPLRIGRIGLFAAGIAAILAMVLAACASADPAHNIYLGFVFGITGTASAMALAICCAVVVRSAIADDQLRQAQLAAAAASARQQSRDNSARVILRYLHNTVVNTLHAIALGAGQRDPDTIRARCASDLSDFPELNPVRETIRLAPAEIAASASDFAHRVNLKLVCEAAGDPVEIPATTRSALMTALSETLVNSSKYAGGTVQLDIHSSPNGIWIQLRDHGPGIPTNAAAGFGLTESIFNNCRDHDIAVSVRNEAGGPTGTSGTVTEFLWSSQGRQEPADSPATTIPPLLPGFTQAYRRTAPWLLVLCLIGPLATTNLHDFIAAAIGWLVILLCTVRALAQVNSRTQRTTLIALAAVVLSACAGGLYATASADGGPNVSAYTAGMLGLVAVAAITLSRRWVLASWLAYLAAIAIACGSFGTPSTAIAVGNLIPFVALMAVLTAYRTHTDRIAKETALMATALIQAAELAGRDAAIESRWRAISAEVTALLTAIADGRQDSNDAATIARAASLEQYTRALLAVPVSSADAEDLLTQAINLLTNCGYAVEVRIVDIDDTAISPEIFTRFEAELNAAPPLPDSVVGISLHTSNGHGVLVLNHQTAHLITW